MKVTNVSNFNLERVDFNGKYYYRSDSGSWFNSEFKPLIFDDVCLELETAYQVYKNPKYELFEDTCNNEDGYVLTIGKDNFWFPCNKSSSHFKERLESALNSLIGYE